MIDVRTKNISFLKISKMLRDKNVKNNKFMLQLNNPNLQGVDPHRTDLTDKQKIEIYRECVENYWYFIREVCLVPVSGANIHYEANLGNITMSYVKLKNKNFMLILPRQHGKTMGEAVFDVWALCFATKNTNCTYMNKAKGDAIKNVKLWNDIKMLLPRWLLDNFILDKKEDIDNVEYKEISKLNNTMKVVSGGSDPDSADKAGRGLTTALLVFDEFAFLKYNDIIYQAAVHAWNKAAEMAKKNGVPYGISIITTPNTNEEGTPGGYCHDIMENSAKWELMCFDMSDDELNKYIELNSTNNFLFIQYTYLELGRDDAWLRDQIRQCQGDTLKVEREILLKWPQSTEGRVFNVDQLNKVYEFVKEPTVKINVNGYIINFFETPDLRLNYIMSCDVAGGLDGDNSVILFIHPEDFRVVGEFLNKKIDTDNFKMLIYDLMTIYFRNAILVCEKNSYGLNILDWLMKKPEVEPRMYREDKEKVGEKTLSNGFTVKKKSKVIMYGVDTNTTTRAQMIDMLLEIVETEYDKLISGNIYKDLQGLEKKRNNKIEHSSRTHDDALMAYLIFRWAVYYGKCLRDRFGINPIPSRMNVRTSSSAGDMHRIERLIEKSLMLDNLPSGYSETVAALQEDAAKKKYGKEDNRYSESADKIASFFRMTKDL